MYAVRKKFHGPARLQSQNLVPLCDAPAAGAGDYCCCKSEQAQCRGLAGFAERPPDPGGNSGWPYAKPGLVGATQGPWSDKQSNIERERGWVGGECWPEGVSDAGRSRLCSVAAMEVPTQVRYGVQMLRTGRALNPGLRLDVTSVEIFNAYLGMLCRTPVGSEKPRK